MALKKFKFVDSEEIIYIPGIGRRNKSTMTDEMVVKLLKKNASWSKHFIPIEKKPKVEIPAKVDKEVKKEEKEKPTDPKTMPPGFDKIEDSKNK